MGSNFHSSQYKIYFSQFIEVMEFLIMFEIGRGTFYVTHPSYFKQWKINQNVNIPNLSIDSKLGLLSFGLRYTSKFFQLYKEILGFLNVTLSGLLNFFRIHEKDGKLGYMNISLGWVLKVLFNPLQSYKIGIFEAPLISYIVKLWG